jgi:Cu(I)/Ag(I) efflux system protein CusF
VTARRTAIRKFIAAASIALLAGAAFATDAHHGARMADGEVRKVDKDNNKITLRHGEIKSLDMPGMTMVFRVKDPALLDKVKVGDKVRFAAEQTDGALFVTAIEPAR